MIIGVDLGGMSVKAACFRGGAPADRVNAATNRADPPERTAHIIAELCAAAARAAGCGLHEMEGIGVGSPGVIDSENGAVVKWSNFGWENVPLAALISKETGVPVFVTNDANAAALGEAKYGAGKNYRNSVFLTLGTGVGGGVILEGKLFEGGKSAGAELGHTVIRQDGEQCACGRRGCFECYASTTALIRYTREEMAQNKKSALWKHAKNFDEVDGRTVFSALKEGDGSARRVLDTFIAALGEGIANFANIFRPEAFILGGGVSKEGETLLAPLREYVLPRLYVSADYAPLELLAATLGNDAGLYGAAEYALSRLAT